MGPLALSENRPKLAIIVDPPLPKSQAAAPSKGRPRVAARHDSAEAVGSDGLGVLRAGAVEEVMPWRKTAGKWMKSGSITDNSLT